VRGNGAGRVIEGASRAHSEILSTVRAILSGALYRGRGRMRTPRQLGPGDQGRSVPWWADPELDVGCHAISWQPPGDAPGSRGLG
jgi:hypothetical protein